MFDAKYHQHQDLMLFMQIRIDVVLTGEVQKFFIPLTNSEDDELYLSDIFI